MKTCRNWPYAPGVRLVAWTAGLGLLAATAAYADALPPRANLAAFLAVLEGGILLVEALTYLIALRLGWRGALLTSAVANVASFLVGLPVQMLTAPIAYLPALRWLVGFAVTLGVEVPLVVRLNRAYPRRRRLIVVAVIVNLVTYTVAAWVLLSIYP
jgi:hypothetical protein